MKKLILTLSTVAAIAAPVASVIACGETTNELPTLNNGLKASAVYTYILTDDMSKEQFIALDEEFSTKWNEFWDVVEENSKDLVDGPDEVDKANEYAYYKKTQVPAFKIIYKEKTFWIDVSMGDDAQYITVDETDLRTTIKSLATKLGLGLEPYSTSYFKL